MKHGLIGEAKATETAALRFVHLNSELQLRKEMILIAG